MNYYYSLNSHQFPGRGEGRGPAVREDGLGNVSPHKVLRLRIQGQRRQLGLGEAPLGNVLLQRHGRRRGELRKDNNNNHSNNNNNNNH